MKLQLTLVAQACNGWPRISLTINQELVWQGLIEHTQNLEFDFDPRPSNRVRLSMDNKINGPEKWDTRLAQNGEIIEDKNCRFENIRLDGARLAWLEYELEYQFDQGSSEYANGFMSQNGWYEFDFPQDVYHWILDNRRRVWPARERQSSLTYDSVYFGDNENKHVRHLLDACHILVNKF